jgi:alpha-1,2-mannosyltransferase
MTAVAVVAVLARAELAVHRAGLQGLHGYDDGVYYAGAAALLAGRMPYSDFVFLHPPGILLALSPFAALGAATSDPTGLVTARVAFWVLGGVNAALVARVAARHGRLAAGVGGLCYALWFPAVFAERTTLLEPLGNTALLVALLLLGRTDRTPSARAQLLAGAVVGLGVCVKLWMVAPLAVLVVWQLLGPGWRAAARVAGGAVLVGAVVATPFAGSSRSMFRMLVLDQLGRVSELSTARRITGIAGLRPWATVLGDTATLGVLAVGALVAAAAMVTAWRAGGPARWYVCLLVVNVAVVLAIAPNFDHYYTFAAVPWALVVAVAVGRWQRATRPQRSWLPLAATLAVLAVLYEPAVTMDVGRPFPGRQLATAAPDRPCVVADVPTALAAMDVLSRDLRRGCPAVVDFAGPIYGRPFAMLGPDGHPVPRSANRRWQQHLLRSLTSGSALVVVDADVTGISPATMRRLNRLPVLAQAGGYELHRGTDATAPTGPAGRSGGGER